MGSNRHSGTCFRSSAIKLRIAVIRSLTWETPNSFALTSNSSTHASRFSSLFSRPQWFSHPESRLWCPSSFKRRKKRKKLNRQGSRGEFVPRSCGRQRRAQQSTDEWIADQDAKDLCVMEGGNQRALDPEANVKLWNWLRKFGAGLRSHVPCFSWFRVTCSFARYSNVAMKWGEILSVAESEKTSPDHSWTVSFPRATTRLQCGNSPPTLRIVDPSRWMESDALRNRSMW